MRGILMQLLNSHPAIVTRIVNENKSAPTTDKPSAILFKVVITGGRDKISAIRMVRCLTGAGLKEARAFIEGTQVFQGRKFGVLGENLSIDAAHALYKDAMFASGVDSSAILSLEILPQNRPYSYPAIFPPSTYK